MWAIKTSQPQENSTYHSCHYCPQVTLPWQWNPWQQTPGQPYLVRKFTLLTKDKQDTKWGSVQGEMKQVQGFFPPVVNLNFFCFNSLEYKNFFDSFTSLFFQMCVLPLQTAFKMNEEKHMKNNLHEKLWLLLGYILLRSRNSLINTSTSSPSL